MFLKMRRGGKVKEAYRKADQDIARDLIMDQLQLDFFYFDDFEEQDFKEATSDLKEFGVNDNEFDLGLLRHYK